MYKILIIEDEFDVRDNIAKILKYEGYNVQAAANGLEGVEMALKTIPDLIICDVMMPEMNGFQVVEKLRNEKATATVPFIFLTARADKADIRHGMELGADDYLIKPFTRHELLHAINARLSRQINIEKRAQVKLDSLRQSIAFAMPHEFLTPLNGIIGYSELMLQMFDSLDRAESLEMLCEIKKAGDRLHRLIKNYLLYAELEIKLSNPEKKVEIDFAETHLANEVLVSTANALAFQANRNADLEFNVLDASIKISESYFKKIIEEIISNAIKYSMPGSKIKISNALSDGKYVLTVEDAGRGMRPDQISSIGAYMQFERKFYEQQGAGLGLSIVSKIANVHSGDVNIESEINKYTRVTVRLPLAAENGTRSHPATE